MIGLDTCVIIDLLRGDENLIKLIDSFDEEICLCQISYFELSFGINPKIKSHLEEEKTYDKLFSAMKVVKITNDLFKYSSRFFWKMKSAGREIGKMDSIIISSFMSAGVDKIITKDKHFEEIKGLKVLKY